MGKCGTKQGVCIKNAVCTFILQIYIYPNPLIATCFPLHVVLLTVKYYILLGGDLIFHLFTETTVMSVWSIGKKCYSLPFINIYVVIYNIRITLRKYLNLGKYQYAISTLFVLIIKTMWQRGTALSFQIFRICFRFC